MTSPSPKETPSKSTVSTTLLVAIGDKDGRRLSPYMLVAVPTPSTTSSATPPTSKEKRSERVVSTTLLIQQVDKDGRVLNSGRVTVPPMSITSLDTPPTRKESSPPDGGGSIQGNYRQGSQTH